MFLIRTTNKKAEVGRTMKKKLMIFLVLSLLLVSGCSSSDESSDSEKKKTDMEKMEANLDDPYILITDKKISNIQEILPLLGH